MKCKNNMNCKEMHEIQAYLNNKKDYAIFGGFASFLHTKTLASNDIDIWINSKGKIKELKKYFLGNGWQIKKEAEHKEKMKLCLKKKKPQ